jgi:hypothetical protein
MTRVVLPRNNGHGGKAFPPKNGIKNLWVVIFSLGIVPKYRAAALKDWADISNDAADVQKLLPAVKKIGRVGQNNFHRQ